MKYVKDFRRPGAHRPASSVDPRLRLKSFQPQRQCSSGSGYRPDPRYSRLYLGFAHWRDRSVPP